MSVPTPRSPTFLDRGVQQGWGALGRVVCQHRGVVGIAGVEPATRTAQQPVGIAGVEPATSPSRTGRSAKLSYTPTACWVTDQCPSPRWRSRLRVSDSDSPSQTGRSAKLSHIPVEPEAGVEPATSPLPRVRSATELHGPADPILLGQPRHGTATSGGLASVPSSHTVVHCRGGGAVCGSSVLLSKCGRWCWPGRCRPSRRGGTRTPNRRFWRPLLYQLSYAPM